MTFIELLTAIVVGATILALIIGIFPVWNGRRTRSFLTTVIRETNAQTQALIKETQSLIVEGQKATQ
jgi:hypothetical protein